MCHFSMPWESGDEFDSSHVVQFLAAISSKSVNSMKFRGLLFVVSETMCSSNHLQYEDF